MRGFVPCCFHTEAFDVTLWLQTCIYCGSFLVARRALENALGSTCTVVHGLQFNSLSCRKALYCGAPMELTPSSVTSHQALR